MRRHLTPVNRFWKHVSKTKTCWFYSGNGLYGKIRVIKNGKWNHQPAHRFSWELHKGEIPKGLFVCHKCDVRHCVNPDHLFLGTLMDNTIDMVNKRRQARGEKIANAKLTEKEVRKIRKIYKWRDKEFGTYGLAKKFGTVNSTIHFIITRRTWKHVV